MRLLLGWVIIYGVKWSRFTMQMEPLSIVQSSFLQVTRYVKDLFPGKNGGAEASVF